MRVRVCFSSIKRCKLASVGMQSLLTRGLLVVSGGDGSARGTRASLNPFATRPVINLPDARVRSSSVMSCMFALDWAKQERESEGEHTLILCVQTLR